MSSSDLIRWGSLAVVVAGVKLLVAELLELLPAFDDYRFSELALTAVFASQQALYLFGLILLRSGCTLASRGPPALWASRASWWPSSERCSSWASSGPTSSSRRLWQSGRPNFSARAVVSPASSCRFSSTLLAGSC
jgi:hypothetical protein